MGPMRWGDRVAVCPEQGPCQAALQPPWEPWVQPLTRVSRCVGTF